MQHCNDTIAAELYTKWQMDATVKVGGVMSLRLGKSKLPQLDSSLRRARSDPYLDLEQMPTQCHNILTYTDVPSTANTPSSATFVLITIATIVSFLHVFIV